MYCAIFIFPTNISVEDNVPKPRPTGIKQPLHNFHLLQSFKYYSKHEVFKASVIYKQQTRLNSLTENPNPYYIYFYIQPYYEFCHFQKPAFTCSLFMPFPLK